MTITAKIIKDSVNSLGIRITTLQLRYPRFIHAEFMTHRAFSRNASSSRAIPVNRLADSIESDPGFPIFWGKNQPGMQAYEEHNQFVKDPYTGLFLTKEEAWRRSAASACAWARAFADAGYHKQISNRHMENLGHINVLVTATEWFNFFELRRHKDAQPEIHALADAIWYEMLENTPKFLDKCEWHLPYIDDDSSLDLPTAVKVSVARCARVSYLTHEGKVPTVEEDIKLYERLVSSVPLHASPCEHQATPDKFNNYHNWQKQTLHGNFIGWIQYRKLLEENIPL